MRPDTVTRSVRPQWDTPELRSSSESIGWLASFRKKYLKAVWKIRRDVLRQKYITVPLGTDLKITVRTIDVIGRIIYLQGCFERGVMWAMQRLIGPGMTVFDLGANIGQMSLLASRAVGSSGTVHAFEPCRSVFLELERNIGLNQILNVSVNQLAVGEKTAQLEMNLFEPGMEAYSSLRRGKRERGEIKPVSKSTVRVTTLDDYIAENKIAQVDLIKMDIEGGELMALKGGERLLRNNPSIILVMETTDLNARAFGWSADDMWEFLKTDNFMIVGIMREKCGSCPLESKEEFITHCNLEENFVAARDPERLKAIL